MKFRHLIIVIEITIVSLVSSVQECHVSCSDLQKWRPPNERNTSQIIVIQAYASSLYKRRGTSDTSRGPHLFRSQKDFVKHRIICLLPAPSRNSGDNNLRRVSLLALHIILRAIFIPLIKGSENGLPATNCSCIRQLGQENEQGKQRFSYRQHDGLMCI